MNDAPKPKLRWYQFSLRALFGLMTVVALFFAWFGHQYRQGQKVKTTIEKLGGTVFILKRWDRRFGRAISANLSHTDIGDQELARIAELPTLQTLLLEDTAITDEGLVHMQKLRNLHMLYISDTDISDQGLEHLKHASKLVFLQAHRTRITDRGVAELKRVLPELDVYYTAP